MSLSNNRKKATMTCTDPEALGAQCAVCSLRELRVGGPVASEWPRTPPNIAVVGEAPGEQEVAHNQPFVPHAPSGRELTQALELVSLPRTAVGWTNAVACRPPGNKMDGVLAHLRKLNKERMKEGLPALPTPAECCRPRLLTELQQRGIQHVFAVGKVAFQAITGKANAITAVRGGMIEGWAVNRTAGKWFDREGAWRDAPPDPGALPLRVIPLLHPAFVLRSRKWTPTFRRDIEQGAAWFRGVQTWVPPNVLYRPTPAELRAFLANLGAWAAWDTETDGVEPLRARLRCVGIGHGDRVVLVPLLSKDGHTRFYSDAEETEIRDILRDWFTNPHVTKVGHNSGYYDRLVIQAALGVVPLPFLDSILLHQAAAPEMPHSLGFVASAYAGLAPAWKADRTAVTAETDRELWEYCGIDVAQSARIIPPLLETCNLRQQAAVLEQAHGMQVVCAEMHRVGLRVDQKRRAEYELQQKLRAWEWKTLACDIAGSHAHNPSSVQQVRELLFERWHLEIPMGANGRPKLTAAGDPSTDDETINALAQDSRVPLPAKKYLRALRMFRKATKLLGTYILKTRTEDELAEDGDSVDMDDAWEAAAAQGIALADMDVYEVSETKRRDRERQKEKRRGCVWRSDGRVHSTYSAHVTSVGRIASSRPNMLNFPADMKDIFIPEDSNVFVGADADQIHLRIAAARWGLTRYVQALALGADPHSMTAFIVFGEDFRAAKGFPGGVWQGDFFRPANDGSKWKGSAKSMRDIAKRVQYASMYRATVQTVCRVIKETEDANGLLVYGDMKQAQVQLMYERWTGGVPELARAWDWEIALFKAQGFGQEPVLGRRRDFHDIAHDVDQHPHEVINFPILGAEASLMGRATLQVAAAIGWGRFTGLNHQNYDSLNVECAARDGERVLAAINAAMNYDEPTLPGVRFTGEGKIGVNLKAV